MYVIDLELELKFSITRWTAWSSCEMGEWMSWHSSHSQSSKMWLSYRCSVRGLCVCLFVSTWNCAETAKPIEMPFGMWTRVGPRNQLLGGAHVPPMVRGNCWGCNSAFRRSSLTTCAGELSEWIEHRLEHVRQMAAQLNESSSDAEAEEMTEDNAHTGCEWLCYVTEKLK